jgi:predicted metalloprotease with PDZ domain
MLDLAVRDESHGQASLREVLQWMNANYAKKGRFFNDSEGVREAAEAVSRADLSAFFAKYVAGTEEIPWDDFLRTVGLHIETITNTVPDAGFIASRNFDGPMFVAGVTPGSAAEHAGLQLGDIIIELQGKAAGQESRQVLAQLNAGDTLAVKVRSRRGVERELKWKIGSRQEISYGVRDLDQVTPEHRARRTAWLKGEAQSAGAISAAAPSGLPPTGPLRVNRE